MLLKDHSLVAMPACEAIRVERRPAIGPDGASVAELYNAWIWLNNPSQLNSYTTQALRELILAFRDAAFTKYFTHKPYLDLVERKFGHDVVKHIGRMVKIPLKRKLFEARSAA